jgi:hypothetical protein
MRPHRQPTSGVFRLWGRWAALGVLAALAVPAALAAPPQKDGDEPVNPPLFVPTEIKPIHLAALVFTAPSTPHVGPWSAAADLYAGAHPDAQVWSLRGAFSSRPGRIQAGASSLFLAGFGPNAGLTELAMLQAGDARDCWTLINTDELRPFPQFFLKQGLIRDRKDISNGDLEIGAYCQILALAHFTSAKAFAKAARHDVTYAHLFNEPEHYRGQVVHVTGRLVRLRRFDPPDEARGAGVGDLYEGWIMTDRYGENPACVVFTDLPAGLKIGDDRRRSIEGVRFDGYFYKRYRYKAYDSKKHNEFRDAPLLIGHTLSGPFGPAAVAEEAPDDWGKNLMWAFLSVVGGALVGVIGLTCWFRYHDRRVRRRLSASRDTDFVPPAPPEEFFGASGEAQANGNGEAVERPEKEPSSGPRWGEFPQASE